MPKSCWVAFLKVNVVEGSPRFQVRRGVDFGVQSEHIEMLHIFLTFYMQPNQWDAFLKKSL